jgi:Holliday junction resolvase RusA-like endonuclease
MSGGIQFTVLGQLVSMKNRKIQAVKHGRAFSFKNPAVAAYERDFRLQVPSECRGLLLGGLASPLRAIIAVFYRSRRSDLDCALVYDCLQNAGVIANDRYIIEKHEYAGVDPHNPRVEISVEAL